MSRGDDIIASALDMLGSAVGGHPVVPHGGSVTPKATKVPLGPRRAFDLHERRGRLGLAMIVRNESAVIERCIDSVLPLIDTWTIVDTGSDDGTQDIIRQRLSHLPGELYERPWVDFAHNRNELLDLAGGTADHLLLLDADIEVIDEGFELDQLTADAHDVEVRGGITYRMPYIMRSTAPWYYHGRTHEYLTSSGPLIIAPLDTLAFHHHADGGSRSDKFERDRLLLEAELADNPDDLRSLFYLAQTRQSLGDAAGALAAYRRRIQLGGWDEEVFWCLYQCGRVLESRSEWAYASQAYLAAWEFRPTRAEPLFRLAQGYRGRGWYEAGMMIAERAARLPRPDDRLFVERWIYDWGIDFERSVLAYWTGDPDLARTLTEQLLERDDVTANYRTSLESNRNLYADHS